jgi:DNA-directed RNA polymerase I, II, and III subunit RPABC2
MIEPTDYDEGVNYEEKGNVREYLGKDDTVDDAASDTAAPDGEEEVSDAVPDGEEDVSDAAPDGEEEVSDVASDAAPDGDEEVSDAPSDAAKDDIGLLDSKEEIDTGSEYDSSDEENYQKLETDINSQDLLQKHPCSVEHSYPEIQAFTKIIRNEKGEIVDELHKTLPFLTKYEYARIIGVRTKELNEGAEPFVDVDHNIIDGYNIAIKELEEKKLPFIVKRPLPNGSCEYWKLSDLELIHF